MSSSSALNFRVPVRDNFAAAQAEERKDSAKVTVKPTVVEAPTPAAVRAPHEGKTVGRHLDAKA